MLETIYISLDYKAASDSLSKLLLVGVVLLCFSIVSIVYRRESIWNSKVLNFYSVIDIVSGRGIGWVGAEGRGGGEEGIGGGLKYRVK